MLFSCEACLFVLSSSVSGNAILRLEGHYAYYAHNTAAAFIGATGGGVTLAPFVAFIYIWRMVWDEDLDEDPELLILIGVLMCGCGGALVGSAGTAILLSRRVDLGGIDTSYGTRAGAVGGAAFFGGGLGLFCIVAFICCITGAAYSSIVCGIGGRNETGTEDPQVFHV